MRDRPPYEPPANRAPICMVAGCFDDGTVFVDRAPLHGMCCRLHANAIRLGELDTREGQAGPMADQAGPSTSQTP